MTVVHCPVSCACALLCAYHMWRGASYAGSMARRDLAPDIVEEDAIPACMSSMSGEGMPMERV
jgi:hypothetical protein